MKYTPKQIPEGINTSKENPLSELFLLLVVSTIIVALFVSTIVYSTDYLVKYIPVSLERQMFNEMFDDFPAIDSDDSPQPIENYLNELVIKLQTSNGDSEHQFVVHIIEDDSPNAFAYPGDNIAVTRGLLTSVESENGLAMVLGHEMGHHYARDPLKGAGRAIVLGMLLVATGIGSDSWVQGLMGDITTLSLMRFSRDQERAADAVGEKIIRQYYGHTEGAGEFFTKLKNMGIGNSAGAGFFNSHPNTEERIANLSNTPRTDVILTPLPDFLINNLAK